MKYGILGDIHANQEALEAVLEEMEKQGVEKHVSVGDLVGYGANPVECIDIVRNKLKATVTAGNHDFAAVDKLNIDFFNAYARESALWTRKTLPDEHKAYIRSLKLVDAATISPWSIRPCIRPSSSSTSRRAMTRICPSNSSPRPFPSWATPTSP